MYVTCLCKLLFGRYSAICQGIRVLKRYMFSLAEMFNHEKIFNHEKLLPTYNKNMVPELFHREKSFNHENISNH